MIRNAKAISVVVALVLLLTPACALSNLIAPEEAPVPTPSRTPKPTFTPTPPELATPQVAPTFTPTEVLEPTATPTPVPTDTPAEPPTPEPPTPTPTSATPQAIIDNPTLNVRGGPGTNYSIVGRASNGQRYDITGRNQAGTWWQIDFNGQTGWVSADFVQVEGESGGVQIASNIPAPPPPTPRPPTATPVPAQPTATSAPRFPYSYQTGSMIAAPNCGSVYLEGKVVDAGGAGINGITVQLEFFGNTVYRVTGVGKNPGEWGFTPLDQSLYQSAVPFNITLVQSESSPGVISDTHFIDFRNCNSAGQFTNIVFRKN